MTLKSKSRNASCVPFRGRGPRSGEGMYEGKNDYDTLILCLIALRSGRRRLAVRTAMEHPIGALPRTPFPASRDFPSRGNERYEGKTASHILQVPFRRFPPLVAGATTLPGGKHVTGFSVAYGSLRIQFLCHPRKRGHYGCLVMWPCLCRKAWKPILPPEQGAVRRSRIGGGERSEPISTILIKSYDTVR